MGRETHMATATPLRAAPYRPVIHPALLAIGVLAGIGLLLGLAQLLWSASPPRNGPPLGAILPHAPALDGAASASSPAAVVRKAATQATPNPPAAASLTPTTGLRVLVNGN